MDKNKNKIKIYSNTQCLKVKVKFDYLPQLILTSLKVDKA